MFGSIGQPELVVLVLIGGLLWLVFRRRGSSPTAPAPPPPQTYVVQPLTDTPVGLKRCPFCAEEIQQAAIVCKHCGADLAKGQPATRGGTTTVVVERKELSAGVAAVLSLVIPGAGQMYCGRVGEGLFWLIFVVVGYAMFIVPGVLLHVICIFGAFTSANKINKQSAR